MSPEIVNNLLTSHARFSGILEAFLSGSNVHMQVHELSQLFRASSVREINGRSMGCASLSWVLKVCKFSMLCEFVVVLLVVWKMATVHEV